MRFHAQAQEPRFVGWLPKYNTPRGEYGGRGPCARVINRPALTGLHGGYQMRSKSIAVGVVIGAIALAGTAAAQVNTSCYTMAGNLYCTSTGTSTTNGATTFGTGYGAQTIITPSQAQQQAAEAQLATVRAQRAQAELDAYRQELAQRRMQQEAQTARDAQARVEAARTDAYAQRVATCLKTVPPNDSDAAGRCVTSSLRLD